MVGGLNVTDINWE